MRANSPKVNTPVALLRGLLGADVTMNADTARLLVGCLKALAARRRDHAQSAASSGVHTAPKRSRRMPAWGNYQPLGP